MTCHQRSSRCDRVRGHFSGSSPLKRDWLYGIRFRHTLREAEGPHILPKERNMCKWMDLTCWLVVDSSGEIAGRTSSSKVVSYGWKIQMAPKFRDISEFK